MCIRDRVSDGDHDDHGQEAGEVAALDQILVAYIPFGVLFVNQHSRDHGDGIGAGAAEGHEVEEAVHEGTSVHQQDEDQADAQQEDIGQDGLLMAIHIGEGLGQEVLDVYKRQTQRYLYEGDFPDQA